MTQATDPGAPHVRVEYDPEFTGGEYDGVGHFAYLPLAQVEASGVEAAFTAATGLDPVHMVHHTLDELYDASGERLDGDAPRP